MLRCLLPCLMSATLAVEPAGAPLPDPYGLGQRLVAIDHLRQMGVTVPDGASDAEVQDLYRAAMARRPATTEPVPPALIDGPVDETARRQDAIIRLRRTLRERHGVDAPAEASETELLALLADHQQRAGQRVQQDIDRLVEQERRNATGTGDDPTLVTRTDGPSGTTWVLPRLAEVYEQRRSPYLTCVFARNRHGGTSPLQLRLVVHLPGPPSGEPTIALVASNLRMPLSGFTLTAAPAPQGTMRAEAGFVVTTNSTRDALRRIIDQGDPRVEYRFGTRQFVVPIDAEQRQAVRQVLAAYAAAQ